MGVFQARPGSVLVAAGADDAAEVEDHDQDDQCDRGGDGQFGDAGGCGLGGRFVVLTGMAGQSDGG